MSVAVVPAVRQEIRVQASVQRAFEVFTGGMDSWWPLETHHIGAQPAHTAVVEPRAGGRWYELAADGSQCDWGRVLAWEPPHRVVFAWHLTSDWTFDPDPAHASELEIRFVAESDARTRVELEHRQLERHGAAAERIHDAVAGPGGWPEICDRYARVFGAA